MAPLLLRLAAASILAAPDPPAAAGGTIVYLPSPAATAGPGALRVCDGYPYRGVPGPRAGAPRAGRRELEFDHWDPTREACDRARWPVGYPKRTGWLAINYVNCPNYDHGPEMMAAAARDLRLGRPALARPPLWSLAFTGYDPPPDPEE